MLRIFITLGLLFSLLVLASYRIPYLDWIHGGEIKVRELTAIWFFFGWFNFFLVWLDKRSEIITVAILALTAINLTFAGVVLINYNPDSFYSPSLGTIAFFIVYFFIRTVNLFHKHKILLALYIVLTVWGLMALIGYLFNMPNLYFYSYEVSTGMAVTTAINVVFLSFCTFLLEKPRLSLVTPFKK